MSKKQSVFSMCIDYKKHKVGTIALCFLLFAFCSLLTAYCFLLPAPSSLLFLCRHFFQPHYIFLRCFIIGIYG